MTTSRSHAARRLLRRAQLRESLAVTPPPSLRNTAIAGFQAALAVLIAVSAIYFSPWSELVGFPALGAMAALYGRYSSFRHRRKIVFICAVLLTLAVLFPSVINYLGLPIVGLILLLGVLAGVYTLTVSYWQLGGPGATIFLFASGAAIGPVDSWDTVVQRTAATAAGAALAWLICAITDRLRTQNKADSIAGPAPRPFLHQAIAALRVSFGAAIAALVAHAAGWDHPAWAAIGATAVMLGGHLHITMNRALQRMAGTVVGAIIAWIILKNEPPFWLILAAIIFFQFFTEIIIGYNYAFGQITITPMALLMTHLAFPMSSSGMPMERVFDTILGAAIGIVLAVIFSSADDRAYLAKRAAKPRSNRPST